MTTKRFCIVVCFLAMVMILGTGLSHATVSTRPTLMGTHGAVACGHYLATEAGMKIMREGGNAIDAGLTQVLAQSVLENGMFGMGGEVPILIYSARDQKVYSISGNMVAPKKSHPRLVPEERRPVDSGRRIPSCRRVCRM